MNRIQIAIDDLAFRGALLLGLAASRAGEVDCVDLPDMQAPGVVVLDTEHLARLPAPLLRPERVVLVAHGRGADSSEMLQRAWEAGVHAVVYDKDPLDTMVLAVLSARLRSARIRKGGMS